MLELSKSGCASLRILFGEDHLRLRGGDLCHLRSVRGLVFGDLLVAHDGSPHLLVCLYEVSHRSLSSDVGTEEGSGPRISLLHCPDGHGDAEGVVRGMNAPEVRGCLMVEGVLTARGEAREMRSFDRGTKYCFVIWSENSNDPRCCGQGCLYCRNRVHRIPTGIHRLALERVTQNTSVGIDQLDRRIAPRDQRLPVDGIVAGEGVDVEDCEHLTALVG